MRIFSKAFFTSCTLCVLSGCATQALPPIKPVEQVDLPRFMGAWYVIACIPTMIETQAWNAVESYALGKDGKIATTFTFRKGGFDGEEKRYQPTGFVRPDSNNAVWGMQFIWPIKAEYIIAWLDQEYTTTIIARNARDYVWLMARHPQLSEAEYTQLVSKIADMGYDTSQLRKVPQQWPDAGHTSVSVGE